MLRKCSFTADASHEIADPDRKVSTLYDMLDALDATNVDAKGLPFTVCPAFLHATHIDNVLTNLRAGSYCLRD